MEANIEVVSAISQTFQDEGSVMEDGLTIIASARDVMDNVEADFS